MVQNSELGSLHVPKLLWSPFDSLYIYRCLQELYIDVSFAFKKPFGKKPILVTFKQPYVWKIHLRFLRYERLKQTHLECFEQVSRSSLDR